MGEVKKDKAPSKRTGAKASGIIAVSISILLLFYLLKGLDWESVFNVLRTTDLNPIFLWIVVIFLGTAIRAYRWRFLLNSDCKFMDLFDSLNIGNLCNMILPLRAGEFIRPYLWAKFSGETFVRGFASVVLERVFDVFGLFFIFLLFVPSDANIPELLRVGARGLAGLALVISSLSFVCYIWPSRAKKLLNTICDLSIVPEIVSKKAKFIGEELILGLSNINSIWSLAYILVLTCIIWLIYLLGFYLILISLDPLMGTFVKAGIVCVFVSLCVAAPSAPGFIGTFQLGCSLSLVGVFAYSEEFSIAYSIVGHFMQFVGIFSLGFLSLLLRGLNLSSLKSASTASMAQ